MIDSKTAKKIKAKIDQADSILLSFHRGPDGDSIGANLAIKRFLEDQGKEVRLISPSPAPQSFDYLPIDEADHFQFMELDLAKYDLFIFLDAASWQMVNENIDQDTKLPDKSKVINIDHHRTNTKYGGMNLVDLQAASTAEIIFDLFKLWQVEIDKQLAQFLLVGVVTDSGVFRYTNTDAKVLRTAAQLLDCGADLNEIIFNNLRRNEFEKLKFWGIVLGNLEIDEKHKFAYSFVPFNQAKKYFVDNYPREYKSGAASLFMAGIEGTRFGIVMVEEGKNKLSASIRSRQDLDVSEIAKELGGGGHPGAAGFKLKMPFEKATKKVLSIAKKYSTFMF
jgi:phosphoesterase RecJ-like protein